MMTISDLISALADADDPDAEVCVCIADYGEVPLDKAVLCTDGTLMLIPEGEEGPPWEDEEDEATGDDTRPAEVVHTKDCGGDCSYTAPDLGKPDLFEEA